MIPGSEIIPKLFAELVGIPVKMVYAMSSIAPGNMARIGTHRTLTPEKLGVFFLEPQPSDEVDMGAKLVPVAKRLIATKNNLDCVIAIETVGDGSSRQNQEFKAYHIVYRAGSPLGTKLRGSFPVANFHEVGSQEVGILSPPEADQGEIGALSTTFCRECDDVGLTLQPGICGRILGSLLSKRFLIMTGLSGSGKTQSGLGVAAYLSCPKSESVQLEIKTTAKGNLWSRDELLVVLDLYHRKGTNPGTEADELASLISRSRDAVDFRLANYLSCDPNASQRGLDQGGKGATEIFEEYAGRPADLATSALEAKERLRRAKPVESEMLSFTDGVPNARQGNQKGFTLIPVGADWNGNENILGYPDGLDSSRYVSMPALQLILDAIDQPTIPHFLILDEMNLSHVERYFADFLSAIESGEAIPLYEGGPRTSSGRSVPQRLELPKNLFVIGTVNVDETTYMFSPKVLDRANVIEFRMVIEDLEAFLQEPIKPDLDSLAGRGAHFAEPFLRASASEAVVPANFKAQFEEELSALFAVLHKHHAEFGFRTAYEASRFLHFYIMLGGEFTEAMDCIIVQKLMPKLHGSRSKLSKLLRDLWHVCLHEPKARETKQASDPSEELLSAALYPLSAEKICRMWALLKENGFASFAEA
jgi:hypothetical protein